MQKIKVIQISHVSSSFWLDINKGDIREIMTDDWFARVAKSIKKIYPKTNIECWSLEKSYNKIEEFEEFEIKFKAFPTWFSIRPGMETSFSIVNELKKEIKKTREENSKLIIHFHEYHTWMVYLILMLIKKEKHVKVVAQHHGGRNPLANLKKYKKKLFLFSPIFFITQLIENIYLKKVDLFYSLSDIESKYLKEISPNSNIKFQTMGIGEEYFKSIDKKKARMRLNLELNKKYALFIGRVKFTKGVKELLEAAKELPEIQFLIIGGGEKFEEYKEYIKKKNVSNVSFIGPVYNKKIFDYFSASDFLILPSYTEGAPVVLMEAVAKNLPVIITNVGGVSKMIKEGREGLIIPPKNSKSIILAVKKILKWKEKNIKQYANKYKWQEIIKKTMEDYKKI